MRWNVPVHAAADPPIRGFELQAIPDEWPDGPFDLVVLSEIAYYFDQVDLREVIAHILATTTPAATVIGASIGVARPISARRR